MLSDIRIVLVDDHPLILKGMAACILAEFSNALVETADTIQASLEICERTRPDIVVVDISLRDGNGISLVNILSSEFPDVRCLVCSMHSEEAYLAEAIRAGARGYIQKTSVSNKIIATAIRVVLDNGMYFSEAGRALIRRSFQNGSETESAAAAPDVMFEERLRKAFAEITGSFCHDAANSLCVLHTIVHGDQLAARTLDDMIHTVEHIHRLARSLYTDTARPMPGVSVKVLKHYLIRNFESSLRGGSNLNVKISGFPPETILPEIAVRCLVLPLIRNADEARNISTGLPLRIHAQVRYVKLEKVLLIDVTDDGCGWKDLDELRNSLKSAVPYSTKGPNRGFGLKHLNSMVSRMGGSMRLSHAPEGGAAVQIRIQMHL
jgi:two-component system, NarL family, nitrate/nitrite response regulator NarL